MAENVLGLVAFLAVGLCLMGIGISQIRSKVPVGFYTGEEPPGEEELSDVRAWNRKHGRMWLLYGIIVLASYGIGVFMGDTVWSVVPLCGGVVVPLPFMIWYHHRLIKRYMS